MNPVQGDLLWREPEFKPKKKKTKPGHGGHRKGPQPKAQAGIDRSIGACRTRVEQAEYIGWTALAKSWQADLDKLLDLKEQGQTAPESSIFALQKQWKG